MVFYDSIHTGIIRIEFNEQYLWSWLRKKELTPPAGDIRPLCYEVEGQLNGWDWSRPLHLDELISSVFYKYEKSKK